MKDAPVWRRNKPSSEFQFAYFSRFSFSYPLPSPRIALSVGSCLTFLGPRGPLGTPSSVRSFVRPFVRPRQKYKSHLKPFKSSKDHARPLIWNIAVKGTMSSIIPWWQLQRQRQIQRQRRTNFQEEWNKWLQVVSSPWSCIKADMSFANAHDTRCPVSTLTQRQRQRQNDLKTQHVLYFWKWYGSRISNMMLLVKSLVMHIDAPILLMSRSCWCADPFRICLWCKTIIYV